MCQIDRHAALAGVDPDEVGGLIGARLVHLDVAPSRLVPFARSLHLDHARAQVGEQARAVRTGQHAREIENGEAGEERLVRSGHAVSCLELASHGGAPAPRRAAAFRARLRAVGPLV